MAVGRPGNAYVMPLFWLCGHAQAGLQLDDGPLLVFGFQQVRQGRGLGEPGSG